jgi:hypothetical protein
MNEENIIRSWWFTVILVRTVQFAQLKPCFGKKRASHGLIVEGMPFKNDVIQVFYHKSWSKLLLEMFFNLVNWLPRKRFINKYLSSQHFAQSCVCLYYMHCKKKVQKIFRTGTGLHRVFWLGLDFYPLVDCPIAFGNWSECIWIFENLTTI